MLTRFSKIILKSVICLSSCAMTLFAAGCVCYRAEPLPLQSYNNVLRNRSTADANVAQSATITLAEAERVALHLNPRLRAAREAANVEAVAVDCAGLWDDPVLSADVLRILKDTNHRWVLGSALLFSVPISGRLNVQYDQARAQSRAAFVEAWGEEQLVLRELRENWADYSFTRNARTILANERSRYDSATQVVAPLVENGRFAATEASMLRNSHSRASLEDIRLQESEEQTRLRILGLMGLNYISEVQLAPDQVLSDWNGSVDDIYHANPRVLMQEARYEVAEQNLRLEVRKQFPDIALGPMFEHRDGNGRLGMGFEIPIPILNGNRGNIARADAERDAARVAWEMAVEQSLNEVGVALRARDLARQRAESVRSIIPSTESQVSDMRTRLEANDHNTLLLVDSFNNEREAKLMLVDAETSATRHNAALWALVPRDAPVRVVAE
jgi:outer membrane protein TolC